MLDQDLKEPSYIALYQSGELHSRVEKGLRMLESCELCPHNCHVNRFKGPVGVCNSGRHVHISSHFAHFGDEDCIRGEKGSGAIFFSRCNLHCSYCQNPDVSRERSGLPISAPALARIMLELQAQGCHNINLVTADHVVPQVLEALIPAIEGGLRIPLILNSSAYISIDTLKLLKGVVDIYLPDFKFWNQARAARYLNASDYPERAQEAIGEMFSQVGDLEVDSQGLARKGLIVRHLIMPDGQEDCRGIFRFLSDRISKNTYVNILDQYSPSGDVGPDKHPELNRSVESEEYEKCVSEAIQAGLTRLDTMGSIFYGNR